MRDPVLDVGLLRFVAFTPPVGLPGLLATIAAASARVPAEVYNGDEDANLPIDDIGLSVLARDIQTLRHQTVAQHWTVSLRDHLEEGSLIIEVLDVQELPRREQLQDRYGIGRGEAASLVLAERDDAAVVYLSPSGPAFNAARREGLRFIAVRGAVAA